MTITAISPYALPRADELPHNRLPWQPDPARAVLLVHDMQRYFLRFYQPAQPPMSEALANMRALLELARREGMPVVYSAQPAEHALADRQLLADLWGPGLTAHPEQADVTPELAPRVGELVLHKTRYSAFHRTELAEHCHRQGRDQLWICGVYAHIGCMLTAFDAFMHNIKPFFALDAVMDFSREYHDIAGRLVSERCGVVLGTEQLLASGSRHGSNVSADSQTDADPARHATHAALSPFVELDGATPDVELRDLGLDSIRVMELVESLRGAGFLVDSVSVLECERLEQLYEVVRLAPRAEATWSSAAASAP